MSAPRPVGTPRGSRAAGMVVTDARSLPPEIQADLRRRVVAAVASGMSQQDAARAFGVSRRSVGVWVRAYRRDGPGALDPHRRGRSPGEQCALTRRQQVEVLVDMAHGTPDHYGLDAPLWSRRSVAALIERRSGLRLSFTTAAHYLARWDLVPDSGADVQNRPRADLGQMPSLAGPERVRVSWRRCVPTFLGEPLLTAPAHDFLDVMFVQTKNGTFFAGLPSAAALPELHDVGSRTMSLLRSRLCLMVSQWPVDRIELLHTWCSTTTGLVQVMIG